MGSEELPHPKVLMPCEKRSRVRETDGVGFSGTMEDVFGIQEEISRQIVAALEVRLTATEEREVGAPRIDDPVAFDCYLRARQVMYHWTPVAQQQAWQLVDQAIDVVGETPLLLATKAQIHWNLVQTGLGPMEDGLASAAGLLATALELNPERGRRGTPDSSVRAAAGRPTGAAGAASRHGGGRCWSGRKVCGHDLARPSAFDYRQAFPTSGRSVSL